MSNGFLWVPEAAASVAVGTGQPSKTGIYRLCTWRLDGSSGVWPPLSPDSYSACFAYSAVNSSCRFSNGDTVTTRVNIGSNPLFKR
jgi:hypothetical protein